jgi:hypothetical protein
MKNNKYVLTAILKGLGVTLRNVVRKAVASGFSPRVLLLQRVKSPYRDTNIFAMNDATTSLLTEHFSYTPLVGLLRSPLTRSASALAPPLAMKHILTSISLS